MSITSITFLDQFYPNEMFCFTNYEETSFPFCDTLDLTIFLESLEIDNVYVVTFEFIYSTLMYSEDTPTINLCKPILITKNSSPKVISKFLNDRIRLACNVHYLEDIVLDNTDRPSVLVHYAKINLF
jgi:hypothetical protein